MPNKTNRWRILGVSVALLLAGTIAVQALAAYSRAGQPTVIVTVNLSKVMENLDQRAASTARLNAMRDGLNKEQETRAAELKQYTTEADSIQAQLATTTDPKAKNDLDQKLQDLQERAAQATLGFQAWFNFSTEKADIEAALAMQDLYRSIKTAAAQMSDANGYDLVLVDDSQGELSTNPEARVPRVDQIRQQVASRRMLHAAASIDITNELTERMNNAFKATAPKAAAP